MVVISALTVGGAVLLSGQKQYDEQNFGLLDIQSRRIESEINRYFEDIDRLASLVYNLPTLKIDKEIYDALRRNFRDLKFIQIYNQDGSLTKSYNFSKLDLEVDRFAPEDRERPLAIGEGREIYPPLILTHNSVPVENELAIMRVKIEKGNQFIMLGIDVLDHFNRFEQLQSDGAQLILFDRKENIIYHPNPIKHLSHVTKIPYSIVSEFPELDTLKFFSKGEKKINKVITSYRKESVYLFYRRVEYKGHFLAGIIYIVPSINLPSFIRSFESKQLFFVALLISVLPLISLPMLKYLFRDLKEITYKAQLYTNGEHDIVIDVHSQDEIGVLALTFQGMIRQVNERTRYLRKSERRIREARDQAEQALSSKSHLLEDLREQKSEIERMNKDKDDLLAIVSHDLKNPLAVIETSMDVIMEEEREHSNEVTLDLVRRSKNSARIALNLITDLLDLARLEGGIKLDFEKFGVKELLENVVDAFYLKAKEKNIEINIHNKEDVELIADYGRIVQVLSNLLGNALKFTPVEGKIDIYVNQYETPQTYDGSNMGLELKIVDTGPGIPANKLESIFNKFEQARANDRKIGTGLGLTIVKNICELHNGSIKVESVEGEGSTFVIKLPRLVRGHKKEGSDLYDTKIVLIANDDELFRKQIKKMLADSSYKVAEVNNGEEFLLYLDQYSPDLIILDHNMPVKDGLTAWKEYIETTSHKIPVILLSDNVDEEDPEWIRTYIYDVMPTHSSPHEIENRVISILFPSQLTSLDKKLDPFRKTVLIVDDEDVIRSLLQEVINGEGYNCLTAKNGVEGLFLVQKYRIDLVVSDIRMSEGDGILLTKAIKRDFPDIPVALMSAAIDGISESVSKKLNVERLITKPFDTRHFIHYVEEVIGEANLNKRVDIYRIDHSSASSSSHGTHFPVSLDSIGIDILDHPESTKVKPLYQQPRILLADDSSDMQILFKLLLRKENITLDIVDNGLQALETVKNLKANESYDAIFMDLNMPEMKGDEATKLIREWERQSNYPSQRIILLSASSQEEARKLMDSGFDSFIMKPINKEKILNEILSKKAS